MLSCREATRLISQSLDEPLPFRRRIALKFHLLMCRFCSRYQKQMVWIREAMRSLAEDEQSGMAFGFPGGMEISLDSEAAARIKRSLRDAGY